MDITNHNPQSNARVELAFDADTLSQLIAEGKLHASDFTCLNEPSKKTVWQVLLANAAKLG